MKSMESIEITVRVSDKSSVYGNDAGRAFIEMRRVAISPGMVPTEMMDALILGAVADHKAKTVAVDDAAD